MTYIDIHLLKQSRDFIRSTIARIPAMEQKPVIIAYHGDADGCCAAYFFWKCLRCSSDFYWIATPDFDFSKAENDLASKNLSLIVFLDMPVYSRPEMIKRLSSKGYVYIYDHHLPGLYKDSEGKERVFYLNPVIHQNGKSFPAALFGWELLEDKSEFEKKILYMALYTESWLERISLFNTFEPFQKQTLKKIAGRIHCSFLIQNDPTVHHALNLIVKAAENAILEEEALKDFSEYQILENIFNLIQNEKKWLLINLNSEIKRLVDPKFIIKRIESKARLCGLIASELRWSYPKLVVGIWQRWKGRFYCELRRGKDCKINLASMVNGLHGRAAILTGGGHPAAAAFTAEEDHFFEALHQIRTFLAAGRV
ncbi:MAG TPA: hypothetical protein EYP36_04930 [Calditrichaeota bacterium]|nr:hypothetical protein [Calditrichota bacterium]